MAAAVPARATGYVMKPQPIRVRALDIFGALLAVAITFAILWMIGAAVLRTAWPYLFTPVQAQPACPAGTHLFEGKCVQNPPGGCGVRNTTPCATARTAWPYLISPAAAQSSGASRLQLYPSSCPCKDLPPTYQGSGSSRSSTPAPCVCPQDSTLPDPELTPGVMRELTLKKICNTKWGLDHRAVTAAMKREVFESYGVNPKRDRSCKRGTHKSLFEIDHFFPRCGGGADDVENLWAQCYSGKWSAVMKDRLEVRVCKDICKGILKPEDMPAVFKPDWRKSYRRYFGKPE